MANLIEEELNDILSGYVNSVDKMFQVTAKIVGDEAVRKLKATSPKRLSGKKKGKYARGWRLTQNRFGFTVHNATDYQLTHLLENGHEKWINGKDTGERTPAIPHIKPVEEEFTNKLYTECEKEISNGL